MKYLKQLTVTAACLALAGTMSAGAVSLPCPKSQAAAANSPTSGSTQNGVPASLQQLLQKLGVSTGNTVAQSKSCAPGAVKAAVQNTAGATKAAGTSCASQNASCAAKKAACASKKAACAAKKAACTAKKAACTTKSTCSAVKTPASTATAAPQPAKTTTTAAQPAKTTTTAAQPAKTTTAPAATAATPAANSTTGTANSSYAAQVVQLVNQERAKQGLQPLSINTKVQAAAQVRATEIAQSFSHTRPNGTSCFTALAEQGVTYRAAGENIAYGQQTPQEVVTAWMNSPGHRANILNAQFTQIGVGYAVVGGKVCWSQEFIA